MTDATTETLEEAGISAASTSPGPSFNGWFLGLPAERQAILREDRWMLAEAAFNAGVALSGGNPHGRKCFIIDYKYCEEPVGTKLFDYDTEQEKAEKFCREVKAKGGAVNIKTREVGR